MQPAQYHIAESLEKALRVFVGCEEETALPTPYNLSEVVHAQAPAAVSWSQSPDISRRLSRLGYIHTHRFAVLPSRRNPRWLLPLKGYAVVADRFNIYTPFSSKARMLKTLVSLMIKADWLDWAGHSLSVASKKPLPLEILVRQVTGEPRPIFALSLGVPSPVRKMTVQAARPNGEILGYLKLPLTQRAAERIRHEAKVLERLQSFPGLRPCIPRVLHAGAFNNTYVLFQSPLPGQRGPVNFTRLHEVLLRNLWNCCRVENPGRRVIEEVAARWEKVAPRLGANWQRIGREALHRVTKQLSERGVSCGIMHGDFAPWNTRVDNGALCVFDWESAAWEAPASWDRFHFLAQTECLLKKRNGNGYVTEFETGEQASHMLYLLHSTSQLVEEEAGPIGIKYREKQLLRQLFDPTDVPRPGVE